MNAKALGAAVAAVVLMVSAASVMAEESVFNQASTWIQSWKGPGCSEAAGEKSMPAKEAKGMQSRPARQSQTWSTDAMGNTVPDETIQGCNLSSR